MVRRRQGTAAALVAGLLAGCGLAPTVLALDPARYATTCAAATDCVPVWVGNVCAVCQCPNAAISRSSQALHQADWTALHPWCPDTSGVLCGPCQQLVAGCDAGQCQLVPP